MYAIGLACLIGATIAMLDGRASMAAAGAALGVCWIVSARLMLPT